VIGGDPHFVDPVEVCHFVSNDHTSGYMSSITRIPQHFTDSNTKHPSVRVKQAESSVCQFPPQYKVGASSPLTLAT